MENKCLIKGMIEKKTAKMREKIMASGAVLTDICHLLDYRKLATAGEHGSRRDRNGDL